MVNGGAHVSGLVVNEVKRSGRYGRYYYYYKYRYRYSKHTADAVQPAKTEERGKEERKAV